MTVCVLRDAGVLTARCPATVKMGLRVLPMMASVNAHPDSEAPLARESAPRAFMDTAVARHAHSVCTAVDHATTSQACVTACLASLAPCAMKCVPVADLGRTVQVFVPAPTTAPVTPSTGPVSATQAGLAVTAPSPVHQPTGVRTASIHATATMEPFAAPMMGNANALLAGRGSTALRDALWASMARTVHWYANVKTELTATTSRGSVPAARDSWDGTVNRNALREHTAMAVARSATV